MLVAEKRAANQQAGHGRQPKPVAIPVSAQHGYDHPCHRYGQRAWPQCNQRIQVGFQPDFKQQNNQTNFGEQMNQVMILQQAEAIPAHNRATQQFAKHKRHANSLRQRARTTWPPPK